MVVSVRRHQHAHLPRRRSGHTTTVTIGAERFCLTANQQHDGSLGEVFIHWGKHGTSAAGLVNGRRLSLIKVARRREHLLFDVPVVGLGTVPVMRETGATVLAVEPGRTLMLDKDRMVEAANQAEIAIVGFTA